MLPLHGANIILDWQDVDFGHGFLKIPNSQTLDDSMRNSRVLCLRGVCWYDVEDRNSLENIFLGHIPDKYTCGLRYVCVQKNVLVNGRSTYTSCHDHDNHT